MLTKDRLFRLARARDQLRDVGPAELSIDDVAKRAALSRFHFIRQFKAVFGECPSELRRRERLNQAKRLLALEQASVTEVCMAVGFSSLGSFSTLFARRFGTSPSAYRSARAGSEEPFAPGCLCLMRRAWAAKEQL